MATIAKEESKPTEYAKTLDIWGVFQENVEMPAEAAIISADITLSITDTKKTKIIVKYFERETISDHREGFLEKSDELHFMEFSQQAVFEMYERLSKLVEMPGAVTGVKIFLNEKQYPTIDVTMFPVLK